MFNLDIRIRILPVFRTRILVWAELLQPQGLKLFCPDFSSRANFLSKGSPFKSLACFVPNNFTAVPSNYFFKALLSLRLHKVIWARGCLVGCSYKYNVIWDACNWKMQELHVCLTSLVVYGWERCDHKYIVWFHALERSICRSYYFIWTLVRLPPEGGIFFFLLWEMIGFG